MSSALIDEIVGVPGPEAPHGLDNGMRAWFGCPVSIATITKVGAVRAQGTAPKRGTVGKGKTTAADEGSTAKVTDLLISLVPVELIAPYTLAAAAIVGAIGKPKIDPETRKVIQPDEYEPWRWLVFFLLVAGTFLIVWIVTRQKQPASDKKFPALEVCGATVAAAGWGLAIPESPLSPYLSSPEGTFVPLVVGLAAVVISTVIAKAMQSPST